MTENQMSNSSSRSTYLSFFIPLFIKLNIFGVLWEAIIDTVGWGVTSHITLIAGDWSENSHLIRWTNFHVGTVWDEWGYFFNCVYLAFWWLHVEAEDCNGHGNASPAANRSSAAKNEYVFWICSQLELYRTGLRLSAASSILFRSPYLVKEDQKRNSAFVEKKKPLNCLEKIRKENRHPFTQTLNERECVKSGLHYRPFPLW